MDNLCAKSLVPAWAVKQVSKADPAYFDREKIALKFVVVRSDNNSDAPMASENVRQIDFDVLVDEPTTEIFEIESCKPSWMIKQPNQSDDSEDRGLISVQTSKPVCFSFLRKERTMVCD